MNLCTSVNGQAEDLQNRDVFPAFVIQPSCSAFLTEKFLLGAEGGEELFACRAVLRGIY
jgi:hypothetical protein